MEQQIRQFKLLNGDDVIAFLVNNNEDNYIIEEPLLLVQNMTGNYHFTRWFHLSPQKTFKLYKTRVMQHVPVYEDISEAYVKYLMNHREDDTTPKVQTYRELLSELVRQQMEYREEEFQQEYDEQELDLLSDPLPNKKTIH